MAKPIIRSSGKMRFGSMRRIPLKVPVEIVEESTVSMPSMPEATFMGHVPPPAPARRPAPLVFPPMAQSAVQTAANLQTVMARIAAVTGEPLSRISDAVRSLSRATTMSQLESAESMLDQLHQNLGAKPPDKKSHSDLSKPRKRKIVVE